MTGGVLSSLLIAANWLGIQLEEHVVFLEPIEDQVHRLDDLNGVLDSSVQIVQDAYADDGLFAREE